MCTHQRVLCTGIDDDLPEFSLQDLIEEANNEFEPLIKESKEMAAQASKEIEKLEKELKSLEHLQASLSLPKFKFCTLVYLQHNTLKDE